MKYVELIVKVWERPENNSFVVSAPWNSDHYKEEGIILPYMDYDDSPEVVYGELVKVLAFDAAKRLDTNGQSE